MNVPGLDISVVVDRIFDDLQRKGTIIAKRRRSGLSAEIVHSAIRSLGLQAPSSLVDLYTCCDGTETSEGEALGTIDFFPGFYWVSLDDGVAIYRAISGSQNWNPAWLPVFANGGGDFYAVVCDASSPYFGEVVGFVSGEPEQIAEFQDVTSLFSTLQQSLDAGAIFLSEGRLKADYAKMLEIARRTQPQFAEHAV